MRCSRSVRERFLMKMLERRDERGLKTNERKKNAVETARLQFFADGLGVIIIDITRSPYAGYRFGRPSTNEPTTEKGPLA